MEIDRFIEVIRNFSETTEDEALEVIALKERFPYSQLLQALSARMSKDHDFVDKQNALQMAAVYAADRRVLKEVMTLNETAEPAAATVQRPPAVKKPASSAPPPKTVKKPEPPVEEPRQEVREIEEVDLTPDPGSVAETVLHDLERLHNLKHNFEMLFTDGGTSQESKEPKEPEPEKAVSKTSESRPSPPETKKKRGKSRRQRIIELARKKDEEHERTEEALEELAKEEDKGMKRPKNPDIIDEIASTKKEITPGNSKQKEQLEIIDHFIKAQPSIKREPTAAQGDLATIKTGEFSDKIVSETLVDLLIKQGKNDKAIEVLKKLIWKFPQKKAYFAAQIEKLKKGD